MQNDYDSLTKQDFGALMNTTHEKLRSLISTGDIKIEKDEEADDFVVASTSEPFYEIAFGVYQFAARTRKLSFKQYKCLSALVSFKPKNAQEQYKQF